MADYNDGNWHIWNGGECPVHPKSIVEAVWHDQRMERAGMYSPRPAKVENELTLAWAHVVKFRVVKEYREPRERWIVGTYAFASAREAKTTFPGITIAGETPTIQFLSPPEAYAAFLNRFHELGGSA